MAESKEKKPGKQSAADKLKTELKDANSQLKAYIKKDKENQAKIEQQSKTISNLERTAMGYEKDARDAKTKLTTITKENEALKKSLESPIPERSEQLGTKNEHTDKVSPPEDAAPENIPENIPLEGEIIVKPAASRVILEKKYPRALLRVSNFENGSNVLQMTEFFKDGSIEYCEVK